MGMITVITISSSAVLPVTKTASDPEAFLDLLVFSQNKQGFVLA